MPVKEEDMVVHHNYNNNYNNTSNDQSLHMIVLAIVLQCVMFLVNGFLKLNLEIPQLWYPTVIVFIIIMVPLLRPMFK